MTTSSLKALKVSLIATEHWTSLYSLSFSFGSSSVGESSSPDEVEGMLGSCCRDFLFWFILSQTRKHNRQHVLFHRISFSGKVHSYQFRLVGLYIGSQY
jgi:hypothetical protein